MSSPRPLRADQKRALRYAVRVVHPALFMEMRLGKTLTIIRFLKITESDRILVSIPYEAFLAWRDELKREGEHWVELTGTKSQRLKTLHRGLRKGARWFLINHEGHRALPEIAQHHWDAVGIDESTVIKSPRSAVSKFYTENFRDARHRFILAGKPAPESDLDYFMQCKFLNPEILGETNFWRFQRRHFQLLPNHKWLVFASGSRFIASRLAKHCFFMTRKQAGLHVKKVYEQRLVRMDARTRKIYRIAEREFVLEYLGKVKTTIHAPVRYIWLRRLCGGFADRDYVSNAKLKQLLYLLGGELSGQQVVIWCHFLLELELVARKIREALGPAEVIRGKVVTRKRDETVKRFQAGAINWLVVQPGCFRFSGDLSVADTSVYYSSPVSALTRSQTEDRIVNVQRAKVGKLVIDLTMENSVDMDIRAGLQRKESRDQIMRRAVERYQREN